jgi:hypothetical protein
MPPSYFQVMRKVLGIMYRTLAAHITKKPGYNKQKDGKNRCSYIEPTI